MDHLISQEFSWISKNATPDKTILQDDNILAYDAIETYLKEFDTIQKEADLVLTVPAPSKTYLDATSDKTILQDDNLLAYDAIEKYLKEFDNTFCQCNKCLTTPHQSTNQLSGQNNSQFDINPVANPLQRSKRMISQVDDKPSEPPRKRKRSDAKLSPVVSPLILLKCQECNKFFKNKDSLTNHKCKHLLPHVSLKRITIKQEYSLMTTSKGTLSNTLNESSAQDMNCKYCGKGFLRKTSLVKHQKKRYCLKHLTCRYFNH